MDQTIGQLNLTPRPPLRKKPHPLPLSILERGGCGAVSERVKDWTDERK